MEQKIKAIADYYEMAPEKVTTRFMAGKLKDLKKEYTGNKETQVNNLFDVLKLEPAEVEKQPEKEPEKPKEKPVKKNSTAGLYQKYRAVMTNTQTGEAPVMDWDNKIAVKKIRLPHDTAKLLNAQKVNSGIEYVLIED